MTKFLIIGYSDKNGLIYKKIVADPGVDYAEQAKIMSDAHATHTFPEGILYLRQWRLENGVAQMIDEAAYISPEVEAYMKKTQDQRNATAKKERAAVLVVNERDSAIKEVNVAFSAAANKRNATLGQLSALKSQLPVVAGDDKATKMLEEKIVKQTAVSEQAAKEFALILEARNVIKNPESTEEQISAALESINFKK